MHPVANVGLSSTAASAITTLLVYLASLAGAVVPANVVDSITVLVAIGIGYAIHSWAADPPAAIAAAPAR